MSSADGFMCFLRGRYGDLARPLRVCAFTSRRACTWTIAAIRHAGAHFSAIAFVRPAPGAPIDTRALRRRLAAHAVVAAELRDGRGQAFWRWSRPHAARPVAARR